jgi:hypothetical protein
MLKEFPDAVIVPCQVVIKVIVSIAKLTVPVKLPFGSTRAVISVGTVLPLELLIEPVKMPSASTAIVMSPLTE